jgi:hypothetical protein
MRKPKLRIPRRSISIIIATTSAASLPRARHASAKLDGLPVRFEDAKVKFSVGFDLEGKAEKVVRLLFVNYMLDLEPG